jgi:hypothetical protein
VSTQRYDTAVSRKTLRTARTVATQGRDVLKKFDEALLAYALDVAVDLQATRAAVAEQVERELATTRAMLAHAEREALAAEILSRRALEEWERGDRDRPSLAFVERTVSGYDQQRAAAQAEVERLRGRLEEIAAEGERIDAEEELLRRLADLRAAVAGHVQDATSLEAVRAALARLFDGFTLHSYATPPPEEPPALPEGWVRSREYVHPDLLVAGGGGYLIEPHPRRDAILDRDTEVAFPELRRVPIETRVLDTASRRPRADLFGVIRLVERRSLSQGVTATGAAYLCRSS